MKRILLILITIVNITYNAYAQTEEIRTDCILAFRSLEQTVGEKYMVINRDPSTAYYDIIRADQPNRELFNKDIAGKILTLNKLINEPGKNIGYFTDEQGIKYEVDIYLAQEFTTLMNVSDLENSKKLFTGKALWVNDNKVLYPYNKTNKILPVRFERVTVINILPSDYHGTPVQFIIKTAKGDTSECSLSVSDTNTSYSIYHATNDDIFGKVFFTKDPKLTYHLSPAAWAAVKAKKIYIGMPGDALRLVKGMPDKINRTTTAYAISEQWVYGNDYYYFKNDKLTTIQN